MTTVVNKYISPFEIVGINDVSSVGGKNSSLGEMISKLSSKGVRVPNGFATTAQSYDEFLQFNNLAEKIESNDGYQVA